MGEWSRWLLSGLNGATKADRWLASVFCTVVTWLRLFVTDSRVVCGGGVVVQRGVDMESSFSRAARRCTVAAWREGEGVAGRE